MIKREYIQRVRLIEEPDGQGGTQVTDKQLLEQVKAHVSLNATVEEIGQYGVKEQWLLHVTTDIKLDEYVNTRYIYQNRLFRLMRQVKSGNEYFSVLMETQE